MEIQTKTRHALIVDGAEVVTSRLQSLLSELDCFDNIFVAGNYSDALKNISTWSPDFILLDIQLPDNNGFELLRIIKNHYPGLKVIVLTNKSSENYKQLCEQLGSDHFVDKSTGFENIVSIIRSYEA